MYTQSDKHSDTSRSLYRLLCVYAHARSLCEDLQHDTRHLDVYG